MTLTSNNDFEMMKLITGGDLESEIDLLTSFIDSSQEFQAALRAALVKQDSEGWRHAAHAMKGSSYNLGANAFGDTCQDAMKKSQASNEEKEDILRRIENELSDLKILVSRMIAERRG